MFFKLLFNHTLIYSKYKGVFTKNILTVLILHRTEEGIK